LAFGLGLAALIPASLRWLCLLKAIKVSFSPVSAYRAYLSGVFVGVAMPGVIGGDMVRVWFCMRDTGTSLLLASTTILLERLLGVGALLLILSTGIYLTDFKSTNDFFEFVPFLAISGLIIITFFPWIIRRIAALCKMGKTLASVNRILDPLQSIKISLLYVALFLSIVYQAFDICISFFIATSLGYNLSPVNLMVALPIAYLVTVLPLSPGGLGVREATFVAVLAFFGMSPNEAALLALAIFLNRVLIGLIGGINFFNDYSSFRKSIKNKSTVEV
jgi:uncharacterized protein (TIRG00374 family)